MTRLTGPTLLLLVALCAAAEDKVIVDVYYPQRSISSPRGSSVKLSCDVYDVAVCGLLQVSWYHLTTPDSELTDPRRFFTTVSETDDGQRRRQVVTEILDLRPEDAGQFQCKAQCETRVESLGHFITITVKG